MSLCVLISVHAHVRVRVRRVRAAVRYLFDAPQLRAEYSAGFGWSLLVSQWACAVRGRARQSPAAVVRWQPWKRQFALGWSWVGVGLELGWSWVGIWNLACLAVSGRGKMTYAADSAARATCAGAAPAGINQQGEFQPRLEMPPPLRLPQACWIQSQPTSAARAALRHGLVGSLWYSSLLARVTA